jgi:phosphate transport system permease protein
MTPPPGGDGGLANAIFGSLLMAGAGIVIGTPIGILAGTYSRSSGAAAGWLPRRDSPTTCCFRRPPS